MTTNKVFIPLFLAIFLALTFTFSAPAVQAQTFSTEQQATLDSLKQQLIDLLIAQIALLQEQIATLIAQQAQTTQAVEQVQIQIQAQPILGSAPVAPTVS